MNTRTLVSTRSVRRAASKPCRCRDFGGWSAPTEGDGAGGAAAIGGLQHLVGIPKGIWGAADNHVIFGLSDPQDVRRAKVELYGMRHLSFRHFEAHGMPKGRAWFFARKSSSPELARGLLADVRPTLIRAGGQTLNAGNGEGGGEE